MAIFPDNMTLSDYLKQKKQLKKIEVSDSDFGGGGELDVVLNICELIESKVAIETVQAQALKNRAILNTSNPEERLAYYDELRDTVEDPSKHKKYVMKSSMITSLRELESVD